MVAAAEQEYHAMRDQLTVLLPLVRALAGEFTEVQTVADIWLTLRSRDRRAAALLGATAIVQLAKRRDHGAPMATEPGS
jgi:hypothetical protein